MFRELPLALRGMDKLIFWVILRDSSVMSHKLFSLIISHNSWLVSPCSQKLTCVYCSNDQFWDSEEWTYHLFSKYYSNWIGLEIRPTRREKILSAYLERLFLNEKKVYWMHLDLLISFFCWLVGQYFESWILFISAGPSLAVIWWSLHRGDGFSKLFFNIKHLSQISSQLCWISHNVRLTSLGSSWLFKDLTLKSMFTDEILHLLSSSISKGGEWWLLLSMVP